MIKRLLCFILLVGCFSANAQQNYLFAHLGLRDGLSSNTVSKVQQDAKGYIWMATPTCLQRYDGYRFLNFLTDGRQLPQGALNDLYIDRKNRVWMIIADSVLGYLNTTDFKWHPVKVHRPAHIRPRNASLYVDQDEHILMVYRLQGFMTLNAAATEVSERHNWFQLPAGWLPTQFYQDANRNYWIGTANGLVKYNPFHRQLSYAGSNTGNDPCIEAFGNLKMVNFFYVDAEQRKWIGAWPETGLIIQSMDASGRIERWDDVILQALKNEYFTAYGVIETEGAIWMAGDNLFAKLNPAKHRVELIEKNGPGTYSLRYDVVHHILEDREKNIWLATNKGLYHFNPPQHLFNFINNRVAGNDAPFKQDVTDILETRTGEILVSTWGHGIFSYNQQLQPLAPGFFPGDAGLKEGMVWCLEETHKGDIVWGIQNGGVGFYNRSTQAITHVYPPVFQRTTVRQVAADKNGNLWFGTQGGHIVKYHPETQTWKLIEKTNSPVCRLLISKQNEVWAGTIWDGLYRIDAVKEQRTGHYTPSLPEGKSILGLSVPDIATANDSTLVFSSDGLNILDTKTGTFRYQKKKAPLANLAVDRSGVIWTSSPTGITAQWPDKNVGEYAFDERNGLDDLSYNYAAAANLRDGRIIFGTNHGIVIFNPTAIMSRIKNHTPPVQLAELYINDVAVPVDSILALKKLRLGPGRIDIKARFTTNTFHTVYPVYFQFEGMDKNWKPATATGEVLLNYLPSGKYTLSTAFLNEEHSLVGILSIPIEIAAPFYKTLWFYILLALLALFLLYIFDHYRMKRREEMEKLRTNIGSRLHNDVSTTLENINILSEMAVLKHMSDPKKSQEFLEQIRFRSSEMISAMQDMLWAISPENDNTEQLLRRLHKYVGILNNRYRTHIDLAHDPKVALLKMNVQLRYEILLLFKRSIKALLNAGAENICIHFGSDKNRLLYTLQFSHQHCDKEQLQHFLTNREFVSRVKNINGWIYSSIHTNQAEIECRIQL
ncbi:hypothetical protein LQ567_11875 [Niabella pedocola]|uniref:Two component regulator three Y domain-containing protein n=1 Tax=Niabella pedocola TaxID=1752077 RepID=A0ABS8PQV0_9BACT|nr:two-component regulator propeller domain-containing protein [Niabella pedocola]MCD2423464.1 hypothetical protein [Niabella pedocola]